jgi:hypothetical protein
MGKYTGATASESRSRAASRNGVRYCQQQLMQNFAAYNRLEALPHIYPLQPLPNGTACAGATILQPAVSRTHRGFAALSVVYSWPFPRRALRHTLLSSVGSLRRGVIL